VTPKVVWECTVWVPDYSGIYGNEDTDSLTKEGPNSSFLDLDPCSEHLAAAPGMRQSKLFTGRP
jgi:hypothetical protein